MAIACNRLISQIDAKWGYVYCSCLHILFSGIFIAIYQSWTIRIERYPDVIASDKEGLFCFNPNTPEINIFLAYLFTFVFLIVLGIILFVVLSFYQMHKNKGHIGEATLKMQKLLLWNLMILSGIPISLGGLPLLIAILSVFFHDIPYGQMLCAVCILILVNYGPIMCITSLFLFSRYRKAVVVMVYKLLTREIPLKWLEAVSVAPPTQFRAATTRASISPITQNEATVQTEKKSAKKVFFVR
ncbi:hypothetical protein L596_012544 [Steinernema carpocapsae]|uniref:G-protein coupled receptors family 1 profile domain-containing protein n=1 Tax=Steinernema carpocapsae TaxID=34508 RepID=A0A4U5NXL6_STECR|nr:hypothetical protein L596_012544 [Steinernema carpocapsae]